MSIIAMPVTKQGALVLEKDILTEAGLDRQVRVIVSKGEIRIVALPKINPEILLEELEGCLGEESASEYDFKLKVGSLNEARLSFSGHCVC